MSATRISLSITCCAPCNQHKFSSAKKKTPSFISQANKKMGPPQSQNDRSAEKKQQLFHFTADQLDEIRRFRCSHPNVNYGNGVAGRTKLWNLNKWEVVPYTVCKYGLLVNGKEIRPITDSDDALILQSIVLDNGDSFESVKKKLTKLPYTVNAKSLMH